MLVPSSSTVGCVVRLRSMTSISLMVRVSGEALLISTCWKLSRNSKVGSVEPSRLMLLPGELKTALAPPWLAIGSTEMSPPLTADDPTVSFPPFTVTLRALTMSPAALTISQGLAPW